MLKQLVQDPIDKLNEENKNKTEKFVFLLLPRCKGLS
jgi:hypothetical protein